MDKWHAGWAEPKYGTAEEHEAALEAYWKLVNDDDADGVVYERQAIWGAVPSDGYRYEETTTEDD